MQQNNRADVYLGYAQITSLSSATLLSSVSGGIPAGTVYCLVTPEAQDVRWRADGTATSPTSTVGYPLAVGVELRLAVQTLANVAFIEQSASAKLNIVFMGQS
jgi:hypothetical protein